MATIVDDFEFGSRFGRRKYPWEEWLDGHKRKLSRGEDFDVAPKTVQSMVHSYGKRVGVKVRTAVLDKDTIVIQAVRGDKPEAPTPTEAKPTGKGKSQGRKH